MSLAYCLFCLADLPTGNWPNNLNPKPQKFFLMDPSTPIIQRNIMSDAVCDVFKALTEEKAPDIRVDVQGKARKKILNILDKYKSRYEGSIGRILDDTFDIKTGDAQPCNGKVYSINPKWAEKCREYIGQLQAQGIIRASCSPWASPAFFKLKPDGSPRLLVDYRVLNQVTVKDRDRPPDVAHILEDVAPCCLYSKFDMNQGFYQMPLDEDSIPKTAFITQWGCYEFTVMPMGVTNAPARFQRYMRGRFECSWCKVFVDDLIIYSPTIEAHIEHLQLFFEKLVKYNLTLKASKMVLAAAELDILGHVVRGGIITPGHKNVQKILESRVPQTRKQVQRFLGMVGYFRKFVPKFAEIAAPLHRLTSKEVKFCWEQEHEKAYCTLVQRLTELPELKAPNWEVTFTLETDASDVAISGVLLQEGRPIAFASRTLHDAERNYTVMDRECLAIIEYSRYFAYYFEGTDWEVLTDNEPIKYIFALKHPRGRHARWLLEFQELYGHVRYRSGKENVVADYFTRLPPERDTNDNVAAFHRIEPDFEKIKEAQQRDEALQQAAEGVATSGNVYLQKQISKNSNGLLYTFDRIIVPMAMTSELVKQWHTHPTLGHTGANKLNTIMAKYFYWPMMKKTVKQVVRECEVCQRLKGHPAAVPMHPEFAVEPLKILQVDLSGVARSSKGHRSLLVAIDVGSRYPFAFALKNEQAATVAHKLLKHVFPIVGIPEYVHSDNAAIFTGSLWKKVSELLGVRVRTSPAYSPQGKGVVERQIGTIKARIKSVVESEGPLKGWEHWHETLPYVVWGLRATPGPVGVPPSETLLGTKAMLPQEAAVREPLPRRIQPIDKDSQEYIRDRLLYVRKATTARLDNQAIVRAAERNEFLKYPGFVPGQVVLFKQNTEVPYPCAPFRGPYKIELRLPNNVFVLRDLETGREFTAHARNLKATVTPSPTQEVADQPRVPRRSRTQTRKAKRDREEVEE